MNIFYKILSAIIMVIEGFIRNISGGIGIWLRRIYYTHRFSECGKNIRIDEGVIIQGKKNFKVGENVWIDKYCILLAGQVNIPENHCKRIPMNLETYNEGILEIGSNTHLGIGTIIQAHAGIKIGDNFTTSAGCKLYSLSNDVEECKYGTYIPNEYVGIRYIKSPIIIGNNVWLGLNSIVLGGKINNDCFVMPNSVVTKDIDSNSIASGFPALKIRNRFSQY